MQWIMLDTGEHEEAVGLQVVSQEAATGGQDGASPEHHPLTQLHPSAVQQGHLDAENKHTRLYL